MKEEESYGQTWNAVDELNVTLKRIADAMEFFVAQVKKDDPKYEV